jgi:hypothetical protein
MRRALGVSAAALVAGAVISGVYFASQASGDTTPTEEGTTTATATPPAVVIFGADSVDLPPPGGTPVPRCPKPTPTPTPPPPTPTPTLPPPDGWILTPDGWIFAPDRWTPPPTPPLAPTQTPAPTPAPWPCIPFDQPPPSAETPPAPTLTPPPTLSEEEMIEAKLRYRAEHPDSGTPVDYPRQFPIGGKTITVPPGAIYYTRLTAGRMFDVIERGESKVYIEKGEITRWSVAPEDEDEFRRLILEPLEALQ